MTFKISQITLDCLYLHLNKGVCVSVYKIRMILAYLEGKSNMKGI